MTAAKIAVLLLILFGIVLFVAEIKVVSHGILAVGGMVSLALGSIMLFDAPELGFRLSWALIVFMVAATAVLFLGVVAAGMRALARRPFTGAAGLVGQTAVARETLAPAGQVTLQGEIWQAVADGGMVAAGTPVRVVGIDGLTLRVVKAGATGGES